MKEQSRKIEKETESTKIENEIESTMTENATFPYKTALPEINVNHHRPDLLVYTPWKHLKPLGFLIFSVGIDKKHWALMG